MAKLNSWDRSYGLQSLRYFFTWSFIENVFQPLVRVNGVTAHVRGVDGPLQGLSCPPASEVLQGPGVLLRLYMAGFGKS